MLHRIGPVAIVCDALGAAEVFVGSKVTGKIDAIKYTPGSLEALAKIVISGESTEVPILTKDGAGADEVWFYPRAVPNKVADGAVFTDAAEPVRVFGERVKVVVSGGGDAGAGQITMFVEEEVFAG